MPGIVMASRMSLRCEDPPQPLLLMQLFQLCLRIKCFSLECACNCLNLICAFIDWVPFSPLSGPRPIPCMLVFVQLAAVLNVFGCKEHPQGSNSTSSYALLNWDSVVGRRKCLCLALNILQHMLVLWTCVHSTLADLQSKLVNQAPCSCQAH